MPHVSECAISLAFLLNFARSVPNGSRTADVVQQIIIPATKDRRCRYVELPSVPQAAVGPARYFISHRWAADFTRELVTLVAEHFADDVDASAANAKNIPVSAAGPCVPAPRNTSYEQLGFARAATPIAAPTDSPTAASPSAIQAGFLEGETPVGPTGGDDPATCAGIAGRGAAAASHDEQPQMPRPPPPPPPPTPPAQPQQHQQRLGSSTDDKLRHSLSYSSGGGPTSRSTSSGVAAAAAAANALASPFLTRPPHSAAGGGGTAVALSGSPSVQLTSYGSQNGPGRCSGPVSPQVCRSVRLRAGGMAMRSATTSDGVGGVEGSVVLCRPAFGQSVDGGGGGSCTEDGLGLGPASPSYSARAAAAGAVSATLLLPGAINTLPADGGGAAADGTEASAGECTAPGGADYADAFPGSLNPLLARPSHVRHQWPHQRFNSMSSRYSGGSASASGGGEGASFTRQAPAGPLQPTQVSVAAAELTLREGASTGRVNSRGGGGGGGGRETPPAAPVLLPPAAAAPAGPVAVPGRRTVTGVVSCPPGYPRLTSASGHTDAQVATRRASSVNGCPRGKPRGVAAAASGCNSASHYISEASDAAATGVSISSDGSGGSSSNGAGGGGAVVTNAGIVDRLLTHFSGREELLRDTFVWLDVFAINQHPDDGQQAQDLSQLQEVVRRADATLLVLDRGGLVLTRIWCLYEIWQTVRQKGPEALRALTGPLEFEELVRVWGELEVERAQATLPADREHILANIRTTTGSGELNRHIKQALVKSACHDLDRARAAVPRTPLHGERAYRAAFLLRTAGSGAAALGAAREAADVFCGCLGPAHPDTLRALRCVAGCHKDMGSTRQAVGLLEQQVIPFLDEAYGVGHTESCALDELGMLYYTLGEYDTAYDMLLAALSRRLRRLQMCAATTVVAPQLAAALAVATSSASRSSAGDGAAAAASSSPRHFPSLEPLTGDPLAALLAALRALVSELAAEAVEAEARRAGAVAPLPSPPPGGDGGDGSVPLRGDVRTSVELVGLSLHSLGLVQRERAGRCRSAGASSGLMREARELMEVSVELLQVSSSEARGLTALDARANLAALVMEGGKYLAAEQLLRDNLTLTERVYGKDHPHTATAANNLALCLKRQRSSSPHKAQEALALYGRCLEVCGASLGESHPETLVAATNMGVLLADQRQWSESERLLTRAVAALPPQLGERHPDVLAAYRRLAEVLELRNKLFESEAMFRLTLQLAESAPPELRDHGLVLECREGVQRVGERMEEAARAGQVSPGNCCVVS